MTDVKGPGPGDRIAQLDQGWDEDIHIRGEGQQCNSIEEAQKVADEIAADENFDAVILRRGDDYFVYKTDEIRNLDGPNKVRDMQIHDLEPPKGFAVVGFSVSRGRDRSSVANVAPEGDSGDGVHIRVSHAIDQLKKADFTNLELRMLREDGITPERAQQLADRMGEQAVAAASRGLLGGIAAQRFRGLQTIFQQIANGKETLSFNEMVMNHFSSQGEERLRFNNS